MLVKKSLRLIYFAFWMTLLFSLPAKAYIDPATTSYIIQIAAGLFISLGVVFGALSAKMKSYIINFKIYMLKRKVGKEAAKKHNMSYSEFKQKVMGDKKPSNTAKASEIYNKREFLFKDKRNYFSRFKTALIASGVFALAFIVLGSYDLFITNSMFFPFAFYDMWLPLLLTGIIFTLIVSAVLSIIKGKVFDMILSIFFGIIFASYIQGNFLNISLGQLTGDAIPWHKYTLHSFLNIIIWMIIILIPLIIRVFWGKKWKMIVSLVSAIMIFSQIVGVGYSLSTTNNLEFKKEDKFLSTKGMYELSEKDNVIILLLDRFDQRYIDDMVALDPTFYDNLDGFTRFTNNTSSYCRTFPSAVHMLTGELSKYETPANKFFEKAWGNSTFIPDLKKANYTAKLYMSDPYVYNDVSQIENIADNVVEGKYKVNHKKMIEKLTRLSGFKYAPHSLKASLYISTIEFGDISSSKNNHKPYKTDDAKFMRDLKHDKLKLVKEKNNFAYYHLNGMHDFILDEEAKHLKKENKGSQSIQMKACFSMVNEFLNQMKMLGVYENSTIIITGDHGKSQDIYNLDYAVTTGLFVKLKGEANTPLRYNDAPVDHEMLRSTILKDAGVDNSQYGETYFDVPQDSDRVRKYYYRVDKNKKHFVEEFEIRGDAKKFSNWKKINEFEIKYRHG